MQAWSAASSALASASFCERLGLLGRGEPRDPGPRPLKRPAERRQEFPATLGQHALEPEVGRDDVGHLAARSLPTIGRGPGEATPHHLQHLGGQQARLEAAAPLSVGQGVSPGALLRLDSCLIQWVPKLVTSDVAPIVRPWAKAQPLRTIRLNPTRRMGNPLLPSQSRGDRTIITADQTHMIATAAPIRISPVAHHGK